MITFSCVNLSFGFHEVPLQIFCSQKTLNSQSNLEKEEWNWRNQVPSSQSEVRVFLTQTSDYTIDLRLFYKSTIIKTVLYWHKNKSREQWKKIDTPEINQHTYGQLIFDKVGKNIQWKNDCFFNKWCWGNWSTTCNRMKFEHFITPYIKIKSK